MLYNIFIHGQNVSSCRKPPSAGRWTIQDSFRKSQKQKIYYVLPTRARSAKLQGRLWDQVGCLGEAEISWAVGRGLDRSHLAKDCPTWRAAWRLCCLPQVSQLLWVVTHTGVDQQSLNLVSNPNKTHWFIKLDFGGIHILVCFGVPNGCE